MSFSDIAAMEVGDIETLLKLECLQRQAAENHYKTLPGGDSFHALLEKSRWPNWRHLMTMIHRRLIEMLREPLFQCMQLAFQVYLPLFAAGVCGGGGDISLCPPEVTSMADLAALSGERRKQFIKGGNAASMMVIVMLFTFVSSVVPMTFKLTDNVPGITKGN